MLRLGLQLPSVTSGSDGRQTGSPKAWRSASLAQAVTNKKRDLISNKIEGEDWHVTLLSDPHVNVCYIHACTCTHKYPQHTWILKIYYFSYDRCSGMLVIPLLRRLRKEDLGFKASMNWTIYLNKNTKHTIINKTVYQEVIITDFFVFPLLSLIHSISISSISSLHYLAKTSHFPQSEIVKEEDEINKSVIHLNVHDHWKVLMVCVRQRLTYPKLPWSTLSSCLSLSSSGMTSMHIFIFCSFLFLFLFILILFSSFLIRPHA